jgi:uncharacterized lipoprotein YmbA
MNSKFGYWILAGLLFLSGCISVPSSREAHFYGIAALNDSEVTPLELSSNFAVAVRAIKIPAYLNRPHIVTQDEQHQLHFAQFDRWAEPLNEAMTRVIKENLARILPRAQIISYPVDFPTDTAFRVDMEITRFELDLASDLVVVVQWEVVDVGYPKYTTIKRSEFRIPVENGDYAGAVKAVGGVCASLSQQVSGVISEMSEITRP